MKMHTRWIAAAAIRGFSAGLIVACSILIFSYTASIPIDRVETLRVIWPTIRALWMPEGGLSSTFYLFAAIFLNGFVYSLMTIIVAAAIRLKRRTPDPLPLHEDDATSNKAVRAARKLACVTAIFCALVGAIALRGLPVRELATARIGASPMEELPLDFKTVATARRASVDFLFSPIPGFGRQLLLEGKYRFSSGEVVLAFATSDPHSAIIYSLNPAGQLAWKAAMTIHDH